MIGVDHQGAGEGREGILALRRSHQLTHAAVPQRTMRIGGGGGERRRKKGLDSRLKKDG